MKRKHVSKPQEDLFELVVKTYPGFRIYEEWHLGQGLRLDIFIPDIGIGFEYHGIQHFKFIEHFHQTPEGFEESKKRDRTKQDLCNEYNLTVLYFDYKDTITENLFSSKLSSITLNPDYDPSIWKNIDTFKNRQVKLRKKAKDRRKEQREQYLLENADKIEEAKEKRNALARKLRKEHRRELKKIKQERKHSE